MKFPRFNTLAPFLLFVFFFSITLFIRFNIGTFLTADDPFFHARMSHSIWNDYPVTMPKFSTQQTNTSNLYFLYHASMSPFTGHCETDDFKCIIRGSQIFHSLIVGLFAVLTFVIFKRILGRASIANHDLLAFLMTILMFLVSRQFMDRILMERPITWSLLFIAAFMYALLRKKDFWIFIIPFTYVLSYSVAFMILIPAGIYPFSRFFEDDGGFEKGLRVFGLSLGGLLAGILIRPDRWDYVLNAFGSHLLSIYQSITSQEGIAVPNEFGNGLQFLNFSYSVWYWVLLVIFIWLMIKTFRLKKTAEEKSNLIYVNLTAVFFIILYPFFFRAIDYLLFTSFFALAYNVSYFCSQDNRHVGVITLMTKYKKILIILCIISVVTLTLQPMPGLMKISRSKKFQKFLNVDYSLVVDEIRKDYSPGELVFAPKFSFYNKFIFYDPDITYPTGMDSSFTRLYDENIFWQIEHAIHGSAICGYAECTGKEIIDIYKFMTETVMAKYIIVSPVFMFDESIRNEPRFELIYSHPDDPALQLYKVN